MARPAESTLAIPPSLGHQPGTSFVQGNGDATPGSDVDGHGEKIEPRGRRTSPLLDRYLQTPISEEGLSQSAVASAMQTANTSPFMKPATPSSCDSPFSSREDPLMSAHMSMKRALMEQNDAPDYLLHSQRRSSSVARSDNSMGSGGSAMSCASYRSVELRGARRGRKSWAVRPSIEGSGAAHNHTASTILHDPSSQSEAKKPPKYFCTWPDCPKRFQDEYGWSRHEEAIHYVPYHWICCPDEKESYRRSFIKCWICLEPKASHSHIREHNEFEACRNKDTESRTFLRRDHLWNHIQSTHLKAHPKPSGLSFMTLYWRCDNPSLSPDALYCGFCAKTFSTWISRKIHVGDHLESNDNCGPEYKKQWKPRQ